MIFISAGHYPASPGAKYDRFIEHDEASIWADMLVHKLNASSKVPELNAILVPTGILKSKIDFINNRIMNGDVAIELHFNAAVNAKGENVGRGSETLHYPGSEKGMKLAQLCQDVLAENFPPSRGIKEGWYRMNKENGPDFFLDKSKCPAVILEPEFVHRSELIVKNREVTINQLSEALLNGI
jgi:hypothetical protein